MKRFLPLLACLLLPTPLVAGETVDYLRDVKPLLKQRCFDCHGALRQKAKLRLDTASLLRKGGRHGAAVVPGNAAGSLLVRRVTDADESSRMPPQGKPLTAQQVALLKTWIDQGAPAPAGEKPEEDPRQHWAFRNPVRPPLPTVPDPAWVRNPLDAFLAAEQAKHGLAPAAPADRATLLRRVTLDLTGLPPTREELHAFLADRSPDAYEKVVDRLLDSPQYGERWARHWMDVWRYSDWYGRRSVPDVMNSYPQIWRWRDWIVRSLNEDRGYDRMVMEMLAADEIAPEDDGAVVATGFLVRNWFKWNYNQWMRDNVEHTGKAFLGLTLNCCHCHDHKYDPITQSEYFQFRAFFEPLELRHDRWPGEPDPGPFKKYVYTESYGPIGSGMIRVFDEKPNAPTYFYTGGDERIRVAGKPPVPPGAPAALGGDRLKVEPVNLPPRAWYPGLKPFVQQEETAKRQAALAAAEVALVQARAALSGAEKRPAPAAQDARLAMRFAGARLTAAHSELVSVEARIAADRIAYLGAHGDPKAAARTAARAERQANLDAALAVLVQAENALAVARRGAAAPPRQAAEKAQADAAARVAACRKALAEDATAYTPLSPVYPRTSSGRRAALARWIASRDNPLTARVAVNHLWAWHFGRPLVETTFNFGRSGARPSHPELLDYLAVELMDNGWRMKHLHRLLVTSNVYRMSSRAAPDHPFRKADPDNRLLWHFPVQRMEAEEVRDSLLAAAGELDRTVGGHEVPHEDGMTCRRRSLYFAHHGESRMQFLELFDEASTCDAYRRSVSVLPQQALALSNSDMELRPGRVLARKLWQAVTAEAKPADRDAAFVRAAFEQVLGRPPSPAEGQASVAFLARQAGLFRTSAAAIINAGADGPATDPAARARENLVHALFNHNDFVTIR
jgi:hypothetical protein